MNEENDTSLDSYLAEVRASVEATTPEPWTAMPGDSYDAYPHVMFLPGHSFIVYDHAEPDGAKALEDTKYPGIDANAKFIARAHKDIPILLEIIFLQRRALESISKLRFQVLQTAEKAVSEVDLLLKGARL
jgi:hypothetical protein